MATSDSTVGCCLMQLDQIQTGNLCWTHATLYIVLFRPCINSTLKMPFTQLHFIAIVDPAQLFNTVVGSQQHDEQCLPQQA